MCEEIINRKGLRCQICTGCGLCPGITPAGSSAGAVHVLAEDAFQGERHPLKGESRRLATADIGTTTVAMLLFGQDGGVRDRYVAVNPQTAWGADVISRIRAAGDKAVAGKLQEEIRKVLEQGLRRFTLDLEPGESLYLVLAANTAMSYLLMGWDTSELGRAPFYASRLSGGSFMLREYSCFLYPGLSAFVGGDILAGIFACCMEEKEETTLLIDLGTNGEMVLGSRQRRISCATAAGPAFEGGVNRGIWGADMVSLLARLLREGIMDETGLSADPYFDTGIRIGNVQVTQEAVRSVQLAKAAIRAGTEILLKRYGIGADQVDRVVLAGGFGYYLKPADAARIGLIPKELAGKAAAGGNTALAGCLRAGRQILEEGSPEGLEELLAGIASNTEVINLAEEESFGDIYIQQMWFPEEGIERFFGIKESVF